LHLISQGEKWPCARTRGALQAEELSMKHRVISWIVLGAFTVTTFAIAPVAAVASESGRRLTTYLLGAGTVYSILKRKPLPALALGAGTFYAYRRYRQAKERRNYRRAYYEGYRTAGYGRSYYAPTYYRTAGYRSSYYRHRRYRRAYYAPAYYRTASYRRAYYAPARYRVAAYRSTYYPGRPAYYASPVRRYYRPHRVVRVYRVYKSYTVY
jgi:hypothetical protein